MAGALLGFGFIVAVVVVIALGIRALTGAPEWTY
jgi:type IV secretory pathway VirB2 component (pilin)